MPRGKAKVLPALFSIAVFILLEMASLNMLSSDSSVQGLWISRAGHHVMMTLWGSSRSISYYTSLKETNQALAEENVRLRLALEQYRDGEDAESREELSDALIAEYKPQGFTWIPATVIKIGNNSQHNYILLDKGSEDGVTTDCGIITGSGVVGIVEVVGEHYSFALSLKNTDVSVSTRLGIDGTSGPLTWDGIHPSGARVREIPLQNRFSPGDTVYTSGHSSIFPSGIPLGTVGGSRIVDGSTYEIEVNLFQDFSNLRFVTIVKNTGRDELSALERKAAEKGL